MFSRFSDIKSINDFMKASLWHNGMAAGLCWVEEWTAGDKVEPMSTNNPSRSLLYRKEERSVHKCLFCFQ